MTDLGSWAAAGTYLEACNCEVICPCRRIGGRQGGRSTYGICMGALSWEIQTGYAAELDLADQRLVLVLRYDDDEPRSPWDFFLYVDESADERQREALAQIFLGRAGGTPLRQFPWVFKPSRLVDVRTARIEIDHTPGRGWFRAGPEIEVRVAGPVTDQEAVTCVIPGHDVPGREVHVDELRSDAPPVDFAFSGRCGYEAAFSYSSDDG